MENSPPNVYAISDLATGNGNDVTPFVQQSVVLTKQAYIALTWKANDWQAQRACIPWQPALRTRGCLPEMPSTARGPAMLVCTSRFVHDRRPVGRPHAVPPADAAAACTRS